MVGGRNERLVEWEWKGTEPEHVKRRSYLILGQCPKFSLATRGRIGTWHCLCPSPFCSVRSGFPSSLLSPPLPPSSPSSKRRTKMGEFPQTPYPSLHIFISTVVCSVVAAVVAASFFACASNVASVVAALLFLLQPFWHLSSGWCCFSGRIARNSFPFRHDFYFSFRACFFLGGDVFYICTASKFTAMVDQSGPTTGK